MSHIPSTFAPLNEGWTLTAVNPEAAPEALRATLAAGIPATVPGEATLDLLNAATTRTSSSGSAMSIGDSPAVSIGRMTAPTVTTWWPTASTPSPTSH